MPNATNLSFEYFLTLTELIDAIGPSTNGSYSCEYIINVVCIPAIAVWGILGNLLNIAFLTWRYHQLQPDNLERSAIWGLVTLGLSDLCLCVCVLPDAIFHGKTTVFTSYNFHLAYVMYGVYFKDVFIKTSTCITMVLAVLRCGVVCYPMRARILVRTTGVKLSSAVLLVFWMLLLLPLLWSFRLHELPVTADNTIRLLDIGWFVHASRFKLVMTVTWACLGYFLPVLVLTIANAHLMRSLRRSRMFQTQHGRLSANAQETHAHLNAMTITLSVALVLMVSPSEILHFVMDVHTFESFERLDMAGHFVSLLHTTYYSSHFLLYLFVNPKFRVSLRLKLAAVFCRNPAGYRDQRHSTTPSSSSWPSTSLARPPQTIRNNYYRSTSLQERSQTLPSKSGMSMSMPGTIHNKYYRSVSQDEEPQSTYKKYNRSVSRAVYNESPWRELRETAV